MNLDWIKNSAELGDVFYQVLLGFLLQHGFLIARDKIAARDWYERAARQNYAQSQFLLYELLWEDEEREEALNWLRIAAEAGHLAAQACLGSYYWRADSSSTGHELAFKWMKSAADGGFFPAITNLALMYEEGVHLEPNPEQAKAFLRMGAERGNPACASMLGERLLEDPASESDIAEGLKWIRLAAIGGEGFAFTALSQTYRFGLHGAQQDEDLAQMFDELAISKLPTFE